MKVELTTTKVGVPVLWWRSVGSTHTAYAVEAFVDELAEAAGKDPIAFRLALIKDHPRHVAALKLAAEKAGWGQPLPAGRFRGVAVAESFGTVVAEIAEISVKNEEPKVHRVTRLLDPNLNQAQLELGVVARQVTTSQELRYDDQAANPMLLADFTDEDLGPGGRFVTRWGADPIRESVGPIGPFPRSALEDLVNPSYDGSDEERPSYVERAAMPIREELQEYINQSGATATGGSPRATDNSQSTEPESLNVGLATYVPRFDIESEKWFVDLAFAPGQMVEPFIRLGLARYQLHAAEALRVSAPVVAWAQIMPQRTIHVWREPGHKSDLIHVQVSGTYAGRDGGSPDGQLVYSVMDISLVETAETTGGLVSERIVQTIDHRPCHSRVTLGTPHANVPCAQAKAWYRSFTIAKTGRKAGGRLSVLVEEIEEFLSTENVNAGELASAAASAAKTAAGHNLARRTPTGLQLNPNGADRNKRTWSGPRMLARIEVDPRGT